MDDPSSIFNAIDKDRSGRISIDEFSGIAKVQLEFNIIDSVLPIGGKVEGTNEEQEKHGEAVQQARDAAGAGVRMQRTASVEFNPKLQGDPEMLTMEAMRKRQAIKDDPKLVEDIAFAKQSQRPVLDSQRNQGEFMDLAEEDEDS